MDDSLRRFAVRSRSTPRGHGRILAEASFEAAVIAFVDDHVPAEDESGAVELIVLDLESGAERCYRLDLAAGEATPCA